MDIINEGNELLVLNEKILVEHDLNKEAETFELFFSTGTRRFSLTNARTSKTNIFPMIDFTPEQALKLAEAINLFFDKYDWNDNVNKGIKLVGKTGSKIS